MKNILILIPLMILMAACNCDESHPLVGGDELEIPDVFVVTNISYTTIISDNVEFEGIQVLFNQDVNPELVIDSLNFFVEGADVIYSGNFWVWENRIFLPCGDFYCQSTEDCQPVIRLSGEPDTGIRSLEGDKLLDGDRDGRPGGDFVQEVSVTGCTFPGFRVFVFPEEDTIFVPDDPEIPLIFEVDFSSPADPNTVRFDTDTDNIRIFRQNDDAGIPFNMQWADGGFSGLDLIVYGPGSICEGLQPCVFRVFIEGSIYNLDGVQLDGDGNGEPGGNFIKDYIIVPEGGPLLQVKSPGEDTIWLDWGPDTATVAISFSLPVGPNNLILGRDFSFFCSNGASIDRSHFQFIWEEGSEENGRLEFPYWVPGEYCGGGVDTLNGQFVNIMKVVISDQVQSTGGVQLDGDYNGVAGGDAVKYFILPLP
ncbi:MAG: hypothetical protein J5I94_00690 [Phaeodactylibacter sp.]|nr:hypothetical protein [Phaeodactylibacter sp.]